jgi:UDP-N-acetylglucosamine 2-epimerase
VNEKKKALVVRFSEQHPNLTRKGISDLVGCTPAFVTQTLGAKRAYRKRQDAPQQAQEPEKVVG